MNKLLTIISSLLAVSLTACTSGNDDISPDITPPDVKTNIPVSFSTYVTSGKSTRTTAQTINTQHPSPNTHHPTSINTQHPSSNTRAGVTPYYGEITSIETLRKTGFSVFGYYTGSTAWKNAGATTTPNFMYNQSVEWNNFDGKGNPTADSKQNTAGQTPAWIYEPVKFWPNGESVGGSGTADDKVSFFSYAPSISGGSTGSSTSREASRIEVSGNSTAGSPKITYTVSNNPEKSIDLLWGVQPSSSSSSSSSSSASSSSSESSQGLPFLDQTKQTVKDNITFQLKHALSKLNIIMYGNFGSSLDANDSTMVLLKDVKVTMPVPLTGTLDLNNTEAGNPAWDKSTYVFENTADDASTTDYNEQNTSSIDLTEAMMPDSIMDIDYGTTEESQTAWKERFNNGLGGIRNNKNINLHKGAYMVIPPDSATIAAMPTGKRVLRVDVTYTVQTIDQRLPKKYYRLEETVSAFYPIHRIKAGLAYTMRLGLSLSEVNITVQTDQWREPVVFSNTVEDLNDNNFDIDPTPDDT